MIKITPFVLFIIILIVLVISVIYGNAYGAMEGFISNNVDVAPNTNLVLPQYSKQNRVIKIYDNLYFDQQNANLIEIDSSPQTPTPTTTSGTTNLLPLANAIKPLIATAKTSIDSLISTINAISTTLTDAQKTAIITAMTLAANDLTAVNTKINELYTAAGGPSTVNASPDLTTLIGKLTEIKKISNDLKTALDTQVAGAPTAANITQVNISNLKNAITNTQGFVTSTKTTFETKMDAIIAAIPPTTTATPALGNAITSVIVVTRDAAATKYEMTAPGTALIEQNVPESAISLVKESYKFFGWPSQSNNTDKYSVLYIPWVDSTFIHVIQKKTPLSGSLNIGSWCFGPGYSKDQKMYDNKTVGITGFVADTDANNNKLVKEPLYDADKELFQISKYVKYDIKNANLIVQKGDGTAKAITIYDRYSNTKLAAEAKTITSVSGTTFAPFIQIDESGQTMILYMPIAKKTVILLMKYTDDTKTKFTLANLCCFTENGIDRNNQMDNTYNTYSSDNDRHRDSNNDRRRDGDDDYNANFSRFNDYYNYNRRSNGPNYSDDYMLKTQIIPPVCPSCASCPSCSKDSASTCTNCGGNGGAGAVSNSLKLDASGNIVDASGNIIVKTSASATTGAATGTSTITGAVTGANTGNVYTGASATGNVIGKTVDTAGNIIGGAENIVGKTVDAAGNIIGGAGNIVGKTVDAAGNIVGGAISETGSLIRGAGSGATSLLRDAGSGIKDILTPGQQNQPSQQLSSGNTPMNLGTQNQYADQYSYYGQLPTKPSTSFMPVTTGFAAFGK